MRVEKQLVLAGINYLGAAVAYERRLGSSLTAYVSAGAHYSFYSTNLPIGGTRFVNVIDPHFGRDYSTAALLPYLAGELRVYPRLLVRQRQGKDIRRQAGSFLGLFAEAALATDRLIKVPNLAAAHPVGLRYGLRRNVGAHLLAEGSLGIVSKISPTQRTLMPRLDASLNWVL
ncbi:hypothetical protein B0919_03485 [Hymenobacter sp. CRA2]|nr:hypothetical protein B0919_03485 [Hymenobacter sp. CRA2]